VRGATARQPGQAMPCGRACPLRQIYRQPSGNRIEISTSEAESVITAKGRYDPRQGAGGYAPIIGALGALAVPGIVIIFTIPTKPTPHQVQLMTLAAGLLIVSVNGHPLRCERWPSLFPCHGPRGQPDVAVRGARQLRLKLSGRRSRRPWCGSRPWPGLCSPSSRW
jgi:hypothetical protein